MDSPNTHETRALSPRNSTRRRSNSVSNSPEFEFWMVRNPSFPQPNLLSADELFVDGVLLPLHLLPNKPSDPPDQNQHPDPKPSKKEPGEEAEVGPESRHVTAELTNGLTSSKRWKDIFKKGDKKSLTKNVEEREKEEKRREKKSQNGGATSAELNINIWPFSRSRSAGNSGTRPRMVSGFPETRKASSAPCSRSNSAGESKLKKWPGSPGRAGVHLGRSSPIWQVNRGGGGRGSSGLAKSSEGAVRNGEKVGSKKETRGKLADNGSNNNKVRVTNVNVPMCIGYRHHLSCRSDENSAIDSGGGGGVSIKKSGSNSGSGGNNLFNLRSLFTKKVY